jgi:predicted porin
LEINAAQSPDSARLLEKVGLYVMTRLLWTAALSGAAAFFCPETSRADDNIGVALYGLVDAGLSSQHTSGRGTSNSVMGGGLNDSLWGLRGKEKLDAGWYSAFQLESGFDPTTGSVEDSNGRVFNYSAWVGLGHRGYGELRLGRQYTIGEQFGNRLEQAGWKDLGLGATFKASDNFQFDNTVNYFSPTYGGLQLGLGYSFNADGGGGFRTANNNRAYSVGLKYEQGPWLAVATWDELMPADGAPLPGRPRTLQLGVSYDFQVASLALAWTRQKDGYSGLDGGDPDNLGLGLGPAAFVQGGRADAWFVGVTVPVGKGRLVAQWSPATPSWSWNDGQRARTAQVATLGYIYDLSRRTSLYTFAGYASNYTLDNQFDPAHSHTTTLALGISHQF